MTKILNVVNHAIDLDDGHVLAPGETANIDAGHPHNKALLEQGTVLVIEEEKQKRRPVQDDDQTREDPKP